MTTRQELEQAIVATNTSLGLPYVDKDNNTHPPKVLEMSLVELLRNVHPMYRVDFAHKLLQEKAISMEEAKEFTTVMKR